MYKCKYCGLAVEDMYDNCPNCGSVEFEPYHLREIVKRTTPPEKGYDVKASGLFSLIMAATVVLIIGISMFVGMYFVHTKVIFAEEQIVSLDLYAVKYLWVPPFEIVICIVGLYFIIEGLSIIYKNIRSCIHIKWLAKHGVLIDNLPYLKIKTNDFQSILSNNNIEVLYKINDQDAVRLKANLPNDFANHKTVDLLIDPNNPDRYYIDYVINEVR